MVLVLNVGGRSPRREGAEQKPPLPPPLFPVSPGREARREGEEDSRERKKDSREREEDRGRERRIDGRRRSRRRGREVRIQGSKSLIFSPAGTPSKLCKN